MRNEGGGVSRHNLPRELYLAQRIERDRDRKGTYIDRRTLLRRSVVPREVSRQLASVYSYIYMQNVCVCVCILQFACVGARKDTEALYLYKDAERPSVHVMVASHGKQKVNMVREIRL